MHKTFKIFLALLLIILIIVIAFLFWQPKMDVKNNFLYTIMPLNELAFCHNKIDNTFYNTKPSYIETGEVTYNGRPITCEYPLFIYDVRTDTSKPISKSEAMKLPLSKNINNFMIALSCEKNSKWNDTSNAYQTINPCLMSTRNKNFKYLKIPYQKNGANYFFFIGWIHSARTD